MKALARRVQAMEANCDPESGWGPALDELTTVELEQLQAFLPRLLAGEPLEALCEADQSLMFRMEAVRWGI